MTKFTVETVQGQLVGYLSAFSSATAKNLAVHLYGCAGQAELNAVYVTIQHLRKKGYNIKSDRQKGYYLVGDR